MLTREHFGERLKSLRKSRHYTQKEVASKLGISLRAYSDYELKGALPEGNRLLELANLFSVSLDWLFSEDSSSPIPEAHISTVANTVTITITVN